MMLNRLHVAGSVTLLLTIGFSLRYLLFSPRLTSSSENGFPRKIWQTWKEPAQGLEDELQRLSRSWIDMNPGYRYELMTDESATTYVQERFRDRPDIVRTFERTTDTILRADLIRYLTLLADGGVYSDIDTDCSRPIDKWLPAEYANRTGFVVGVEIDARDEQLRGDMDVRVQLCQWTLMSKARHLVMQHVVDRIVVKLQESAGEDGSITAIHNGGDVMDLTGPRIFTKAILESLSARTGQKVTDTDITKLEHPKLIGDVLVLPVSSFASGQPHSGSKDWGNDQQLISHHWRGFQTWKVDHEVEVEVGHE